MTLGKPDAGKPPVRFDEGRSETVIGRVPLQPVRSAYSTKAATALCPTNPKAVLDACSPTPKLAGNVPAACTVLLEARNRETRSQRFWSAGGLAKFIELLRKHHPGPIHDPKFVQ